MEFLHQKSLSDIENKAPLVNIITVVYNGAKTIEQTIQSVINQTYENIEYIIIDGGSNDGTLNIIHKYEEQIDRWISEPDDGLYDAMNKGISLSSGELIGMVNSDDWYELNAVELVVNAYRKNPSKKIFHGDRYNVDQVGKRSIRKFDPSRMKLIYYGMTFNHPSMFVKQEVYERFMYNTSLESLSDFEFTLKNFLRFEKDFFYIPQAYVNYRLDGISSEISFLKSLSEGNIARKNAGVSFLKRLLYKLVRYIVYLIYSLKNKLNRFHNK